LEDFIQCSTRLHFKLSSAVGAASDLISVEYILKICLDTQKPASAWFKL